MITTLKVCRNKKSFASYEEAVDFMHFLKNKHNINSIETQSPYICFLCDQWHLATKSPVPFMQQERERQAIEASKKDSMPDSDTLEWMRYVEGTNFKRLKVKT